jgi:hypothetical protein
MDELPCGGRRRDGQVDKPRTLRAAVSEAADRSDEDLYEELLTALGETQATLYSPEARMARGRQVMRSLLMRVRTQVCDAYRSIKDDTSELTEISVVIAAGLAGAQVLQDALVAPLAVLAVRHGLNQLCEEKSDE